MYIDSIDYLLMVYFGFLEEKGLAWCAAGISKQAQLLRRTPQDLTAELLNESVCHAGELALSLGLSRGFSMWEVFRNVVKRPDPCLSSSLDEDLRALMAVTSQLARFSERSCLWT